MNGRLGILALALLSALSTSAVAQNGGEEAPEEAGAELEVDTVDWSFRRPLANRNQMPLALLFVYLTPEGARTRGAGEIAFELGFDYSNIIITQETEAERVHLDTEYLRTGLGFRRGFGAGIELGVSIPFYLFHGGFLDPFVDGFHEAFNLPNFLRGMTPNGLSEVEYRRGDDVLFQSEGSFGGVGDLSIRFKKALLDRGRTALAARSVVKLPTGSLEKLTGSGATDAGFGLAVERIGDRFALFGNVNYHLLGRPERLPTKDYFSFMIGADWRFKPNLAAQLQFDHARPPLEGEVKMFNKGNQQLALGLRWRYSDRFVYEWRFVEDLSSFSPDFTVAFQVGIRVSSSPLDEGR